MNDRYAGFTAPYTLEGFDAKVFDPKTQRVRKVKFKRQDGATHRGIGNMLNHASGQKANATFGPIPARYQEPKSKRTRFVVGLVATKPIRNHQFLHVDYGPRYSLEGKGVLKGSRGTFRTGY